jgi:hypothetical protein
VTATGTRRVAGNLCGVVLSWHRAITWLQMKMGALMSDGLNVGSSQVQKPVRQIRQCASDCELLTDPRHVLISGITTR